MSARVQSGGGMGGQPQPQQPQQQGSGDMASKLVSWLMNRGQQGQPPQAQVMPQQPLQPLPVPQQQQMPQPAPRQRLGMRGFPFQ